MALGARHPPRHAVTSSQRLIAAHGWESSNGSRRVSRLPTQTSLLQVSKDRREREMTHHQTELPSHRSSFVECVEPREIWYRYVDTRSAYFDSDGDWTGPGSAVIAGHEYTVIRHTPKGAWIVQSPAYKWSRQRFVRNSSRKKYAYPTKAEAWESFTIRKQRQLQILKSQADHVADVLRLIEKGQPE